MVFYTSKPSGAVIYMLSCHMSLMVNMADNIALEEKVS